jgi:hypothetical protein
MAQDQSAHMTLSESSSIHLMSSLMLGQSTRLPLLSASKYAIWEGVNTHPLINSIDLISPG